MATKTTIKFISAGFEEIECSGGVQSLCEQIAEGIAGRANSKAGGGFVVTTGVGTPPNWKGGYKGGRAYAQVTAETDAADRAEITDNALSGSVR